MWSYDTTNLRVIQGHEDLVVPEYPGLLDPHQPRPVSDTLHWFDLLFDAANAHVPDLHHRGEGHTSLCIWPTPDLKIHELHRHIVARSSGRSPQPHSYEVLTPPHMLCGRQRPFFQIAYIRNGVSDYIIRFDGKEQQGEWRDQAQDTELIQSAVHMLMSELGTPPEKFETDAVDLETHRLQHGIEWPKILNLEPIAESIPAPAIS